jgi:hypothetical protein
VADDIVPSLRASAQWIKDIEHESWFETADIQTEAADEIERLRAALQIAAGKLSTLPPFTNWHPEVIYKALLEDGAEEVNRG